MYQKRVRLKSILYQKFMIKFKNKTIRVFHVTKDTNLESIKRDGLLVEKYKKPSGEFTKNNIARPFPKVLYFSSDPGKLIKFPEQGKFSILVLDVPVKFLTLGDPIVKLYKGPEDFSIRNVKEFMKLSPVIKDRIIEYLKKYGLKDESEFDEIYPKTPFYEYMKESYIRLKDFTYVSKFDIPKECILDVLSEVDFKKLLSPKDLENYNKTKKILSELP